VGPRVGDLSPVPSHRSAARALLDGLDPALAAGADRASVARSLVTAVARGARWDPPPSLRAVDGPYLPALAATVLPPEWCTPPRLGALYEATLPDAARHSGVHYTAPESAAGVVGLVGPFPGPTGGPRPATDPRSYPTVWDPACGGGAFLLAAADALLAAGHPAGSVVADLVWGTDLDPGAVIVAEGALALWARDHGADGAHPAEHLVVADTLHDPRPGPEAGFDLIVGNPPFQGQLAGEAVRSGEERRALQVAWGRVVGPYTDTAAVFLVAGVRALAPGGSLTMVLPTSVLSARDAAEARAAATEVADLVGLWVAVDAVFDAAVDVCAPVLHRPAGPHPDRGGGHRDAPPVRRWRGRRFDPLPAGVAPTAGSGSVPDPWSVLALGALGVPSVGHRSAGRLGDLASAAAGFRDEYYGLVDHVGEAPTAIAGELPPHLAPLITSGLVDPGRCRWGRRPARFGGRRWDRPVVDRVTLAGAGGRAAAWAASTAGPKVVVASQTRVGEAAVDEGGTWVASTPTVVVRADVDRLWEVAAVICSPVATGVLLAAGAGSGRAADAIRPTVASVLALPLPVDGDAWRAGAAALRDGDDELFAATMAAAYDRRPGALEDWWAGRRPSPRSTPR
jgi:hypothetical protein